MTFKPVDVYALDTGVYEAGERTRPAEYAAKTAAGKKGWRGYLASQRRLHRAAKAKRPHSEGVCKGDDLSAS